MSKGFSQKWTSFLTLKYFESAVSVVEGLRRSFCLNILIFAFHKFIFRFVDFVAVFSIWDKFLGLRMNGFVHILLDQVSSQAILNPNVGTWCINISETTNLLRKHATNNSLIIGHSWGVNHINTNLTSFVIKAESDPCTLCTLLRTKKANITSISRSRFNETQKKVHTDDHKSFLFTCGLQIIVDNCSVQIDEFYTEEDLVIAGMVLGR